MGKFEFIAAEHHYRIQVLVDRKDGGSLMNAESIDEMIEVNKFVTENVTAWNGERSFAYDEMCGIYCNESNALALGFVQVRKEYSLFELLKRNAKHLGCITKRLRGSCHHFHVSDGASARKSRLFGLLDRQHQDEMAG